MVSKGKGMSLAHDHHMVFAELTAREESGLAGLHDLLKRMAHDMVFGPAPDAGAPGLSGGNSISLGWEILEPPMGDVPSEVFEQQEGVIASRRRGQHGHC